MLAPATASEASSVHPPAKTARRRKSRCSSAESRSYDHSIVARNVRCRGSASRPPASRSSRLETRSRICAGESAFVRAAASSTASGSESSRAQSSRISSDAPILARSQKRATASGSVSGGTASSTSPCTRRSSRLVTTIDRLGQAETRAEIWGAAATTCSKLSMTTSSSRSPMWSTRSLLAPSARAIVPLTSAGSRTVARSTQKTPAL